jgi:predicted peroxiredoxin
MAHLLFVVAHSTDDPDRAATALETALAAVEAGHRVDLWLTGEGVRLGVKGVAETLREPTKRTATQMVEALAAAGAVLWCSRPSFDRREFKVESLRAGARMAEASELATLVADGRTPVPT